MRRRLVTLVAVTTSLVLVAFLVPLALLVRSVAADRATSAAVRRAQELAPLVATVDRKALTAAVVERATGNAQDFPVTVFLPDGTLIGAPVPTSAAVRLARTGRSFTVDRPGGREVLVAVQGGPGGTVVIRSFASTDQLRNGVARTWSILGLLGVGLLALSLLVADRIGRSITRPTEDLVGVAHRLAGGDLSARAAPGGPPELRDVAAALNLLADRIGELLTAEREHVADLSHQLRTPLTSLRLSVDGVAPGEDRDRLAAAVDGVERTVDRVITEARRPVREGLEARCDATAVVADRVAFWAALADDEQRPTSVDLPEHPVAVRSSATDLAAAVDALLGNVFAHTPEGTALAVRLRGRVGGGAELVVSDDGPGLPDPGATERGSSGEGSTGLGLDIVRRTASASGGTLDAGTAPGGGTRIAVTLGPPRASSSVR
jgi:signal transduction histidine kinase